MSSVDLARTTPPLPSSSSSGSGESEQSSSCANDLDARMLKNSKTKKTDKHSAFIGPASSLSGNSASQQPSGAGHHKLQPHHSFSSPQSRTFNNNVPIMYAPHNSPANTTQHINQFPCKYPGCNQVMGMEGKLGVVQAG